MGRRWVKFSSMTPSTDQNPSELAVQQAELSKGKKHSAQCRGSLTGIVWGVVLQDGGRCSVQVCMDIDVAPTKVPLDQHLILLHVSPAQHKIVLTGDEPVTSNTAFMVADSRPGEATASHAWV